jgi:hypothetical protein
MQETLFYIPKETYLILVTDIDLLMSNETLDTASEYRT